MRSTTVSLTLLSLFHISVAQPRHHHNHAHQHKANRASISKRDRITVTDSTQTTTTEAPEVVIYVDQHNNPIRTTTETIVYVPMSIETNSTSAVTTSTVRLSAVSTKAVPTGESLPFAPPAPPPLASPSPEYSPPPEPSVSLKSLLSSPEPSASYTPTPQSSDDGSTRHGVTYSPYKGRGGCKSADDVDADFELMAEDYGVIRLYGVDCDQVATAYAAAKKHGNTLFLGIFDISSVEESVATMADGVNYDWSMVDTVSVGNELVNNGGATVSQSLAALSQARSALRAAGYDGPVVIVDTFVAMLAHPELCDESDYCAVNIHPFFDPNTQAEEAGSFITSTVTRIRSRLADPDQRIVVTETGWPWQGESNGIAIPGMDEQSLAISSIKDAYSDNASDVILFTAFNDMWKKPEAGTFMAEQFWGMGGRYSPSDE
ncbi:glycoside hydrolase superfamily [Hypoxylon trugodes]|uniref:glycoside hydrolase superfamily n=1 Tax=Hypoxylon trugodes TaxID=326681 RepID=UPI0021A23B2D|nr:glycoside hydrolase superfamily [Hypoxylon trugodes]KAI1385317.1 glycoside hydrolase superfamily [Hypoxylon trugodes]